MATEPTNAAPIPATIITGFLGSGKTTLLNHLLHAPHGFRVAVIVNEFGSVGVDGLLVKGGEKFVQLDNGCLCCALNEDLVQTLTELHARGGFDHLVLETTGMADPLPVAWTFNRPGISKAYRVDSIVTVVDSDALERALNEAPEARMQVERADILVLNKLDLVEDGGKAVRARVRALNDVAPMLEAVQSQVPWDMLLGDALPRPRHLNAASSDEHTQHDEHEHVAHAHTPAFQTWTWESDARINERALEDLTYEVPADVYRFKGILRTDAEFEWMLVNAVAGRIDLRPHTPRELPKKSFLVFIGPALDIPALQKLCETLPVRS